MTDTLKPCHKCGSMPLLMSSLINPPRYRNICGGCHEKTEYFKTISEADNAWNNLERTGATHD